ncbi:MAG: hypothetical protein ACJAXY_000414 [Nonlabens sp.]
MVVKGYRTAKPVKSRVATSIYSTTTIKSRPNTTDMHTLSGQVAELNIQTTTVPPGGSNTLKIKGLGKRNESQQPPVKVASYM